MAETFTEYGVQTVGRDPRRPGDKQPVTVPMDDLADAARHAADFGGVPVSRQHIVTDWVPVDPAEATP